jgi:hypothetical protein
MSSEIFKKSNDAIQSETFAHEIPTVNFLGSLNLEEIDDLEEALDYFIFSIKSNYFLCWETVVQTEQGLPLTEVQKSLLADLISSNDGYEGPFFHINDMARPNEPWYEIAKKIAARFLQIRFKTNEANYEIICDGWAVLVDTLETHAQNLSLPKGAETPIDIFPLNLRHSLNLQFCFTEDLYGLGIDETMLEDEEHHYRIEDFIQTLRVYKDSVQYLNLTLEKMLTRVSMPPKDEKIFIDLMIAKLGMNSPQEQLAKFLWDGNFVETFFRA